MGNRFPSCRRLRSNQEIQRVFDEGTFHEGTYCHLVRGPRDDRSTRAAFVVSRKTAARAVDRNRIKRLMRESFRLLVDGIEEGWPLVFLATREAHGNLKRFDFDQEMRRLLEEAELLETVD